MIAKGTKLLINGLTDVGQVREHNEDYIDWDVARGLIMLADGMGGHNAGEVASALAVNSIKEALYEVLNPDDPVENLDHSEILKQAIIYANDEINRHSVEHPACAGMGTTIATSLFDGETVVFAHVGDSRIYRLRDNKLEQMTSDHSLVQEMVDNGFLTEEEAMTSASRNLITRALGIADAVDVDISSDNFKVGDIYLYCSDGLTDLVTDKEILAILEDHKGDLETTSQELVNLANEKGGKDNISVILVSLNKAYSDNVGVDESSTTIKLDTGEKDGEADTDT
ncbi:MAG: Stp1/IreP family PP2C-type Ser/Thr phosphatase [Gammaproteobacteria bacterium]